MCYLNFQTFLVQILSALMNFNGNMIYGISITHILLCVNSILFNLYRMHHTIVTAYVHRRADPSQIFVFSIVIPLSYIVRLNFLCSEKNTTDKNVVNSLFFYNIFWPV